MRVRLIVLGILLLAVVVSFIDAPYPEELLLQHAPTVLAIAGLAGLTLWVRVSLTSFVCGVTFLVLHILGARWIYSFVPYDDWSRYVAGVSLSEHFGWQRNHYDRLVHFASGVLGLPPASECLQRLGGMKPLGASVAAVCVVLAIGALYEIIEWQIAMFFSPAQAEAYNGQQGDVWDPQKDMALALLGSVVAAGLYFRWRPEEPIRKPPRIVA